MNNVAIVTDSVASIPKSLVEELNISWVPYYLHMGKTTLRDLVTIDCESFYRMMSKAVEIPTTAHPNPHDYEHVYSNLAEKGVFEVVSIHITSKGSGAYHSAVNAKETVLVKYPNLKIL